MIICSCAAIHLPLQLSNCYSQSYTNFWVWHHSDNIHKKTIFSSTGSSKKDDKLQEFPTCSDEDLCKTVFEWSDFSFICNGRCVPPKTICNDYCSIGTYPCRATGKCLPFEKPCLDSCWNNTLTPYFLNCENKCFSFHFSTDDYHVGVSNWKKKHW